MTTLSRYVTVPPRLVTFHKICRCASSEPDRLKRLLTLMPKETSLRHIKRRDAGITMPLSEAYFQVVGDGSPGFPKVVLLATTFSRYLFNCGEGTQRLIQEHKLRLSRVENIFFTTKSWDNIGGLPGLTLTVRDIGVPKLVLHGPDGIEEIYSMTKKFLQVPDMEIDQRSLLSEPFADEALDYMKYVPLIPRVPAAGSDSNSGRTSASGYGPVDTVAYIGKLVDKPGSLIVAKCIELGVKPGPQLARLKAGESIEIGGRTIRASDVCFPSTPGPVFIVIECPSENHLSSLLENPAFLPHQNDAAVDSDQAVLVIHLTPSTVSKNPLYQEWTNKFSASAQHCFINDENDFTGSVAIHRVQAMLNLVDEEVFPLLPAQIAEKNAASVAKENDEGPFIQMFGSPLAKFYLRPLKKSADTEQCFTLNNDEYRAEVMQNEGFEEALTAYRELFPSQKPDISWQEADLVFLGTGSAIPSKVRNTSGILVRPSAKKSFLLDCGEGSAGQLLRFFGKTKVDEELRKIKMIFLSHPHADHHIGLAAMMKARRESFAKVSLPVEPVWLIVPELLTSYLQVMSRSFEQIVECSNMVECGSIRYKLWDKKRERELLEECGLKEILVDAVIHCPSSYGISLTTCDGWKICYSGDTTPCDALVNIGNHCDLLIHEATMEDSMAHEAQKKRHSTTSQAIEVGRRMNAKFTLLTHFSQRYAKIPLITGDLPKDVGIAFDNMHIRRSNMQRIPHMIPSLCAMFTEHIEEMQTRSEKLGRRKEWEAKALASQQANSAGIEAAAASRQVT